MIYADNAATTKISEMAFAKMLPFLKDAYGNASSQHPLGIQAKNAIEDARVQIAGAIDADASEIVFTSGGSEANSWVLRGVVDLFGKERIHVITSAIEHHSVLNACKSLESENVAITYLPVGRDGVIDVEALKKALRPNTKLVSIMLANNEIGSVQPIAEIGTFLKSQKIWLHTDAVQAVGHIPIRVNELNVDFLSASAHKFNGVKGTGFLYVRSGCSLPNLIFGGRQEQGIRPGTENVAGIVAAGYALSENIGNMREEDERLRAMVREVVSDIQKKIPDVHINGQAKTRLPGIVNLELPGVSGEALAHILALKGVCVSTSAACNAGKSEPSHVLTAIGLNEEQVKCSIRISFGRFNIQEEARMVAMAVCNAYEKISGVKRQCEKPM